MTVAVTDSKIIIYSLIFVIDVFFCWKVLAIFRISRQRVLQEVRISLEFTKDFAVLARRICEDTHIDSQLRRNIEELRDTFFSRKYLSDNRFLFGRIDYSNPDFSLYFRCALNGIFARSFQDTRNGALIRSQLIKRMLNEFPAFEISEGLIAARSPENQPQTAPPA